MADHVQEKQVVQIRRKGGLHTIKANKSGGTITPKIFHQEHKNPDTDGDYVGDYRGKSILNTKRFIAPYWDDIRNEWYWGGTDEDLARLIDKMHLRYPKNHPKEGLKIEPGSTSDRRRNRIDEVFTHNDFYGKYYLEDGRLTLTLHDPKQEFMYLCQITNPQVDSRRGRVDSGPVSKFTTAGTNLELVSPQAEKIGKKKDAKKEIEAIVLLSNMEDNEDKMRSIATLLDIPGYSKATDAVGLFILLKDLAAQNTAHTTKHNTTWQKAFIEFANMPDADLNINSQIVGSRKRGIVRKGKGYYLFNGEKLDGLSNDKQLIEFFRDPENQDKYLDLVAALENLDLNIDGK